VQWFAVLFDLSIVNLGEVNAKVKQFLEVKYLRYLLVMAVFPALENGEGSVGGGDSLRDLSRVKKTLRQLLGDLKKVMQISRMSS